MTDTNVKFKSLTGTKPNSYSNWKITKEQILDNALCYLSNKGVTINNPYCNETDKKLFRRIISKLLNDYIVPVIFKCNDGVIMDNNDDISEYFDKAIKKLKKIYTNDNMNDLIYESAKKDDYEAFGISTANYHYRFSFNQYKKLLVFQFDNPANFDIPFFSERFKRYNIYFELMFWKTPNMYFLPRFFLYYHDKIDRHKFTDEEIETYIMLRAFTKIRKEYRNEIAEYYATIIDNIKEFADRILTIDYKALLQHDIKDISECEKALGTYKINCEEIWSFLERYDIPIEEIIDYIRALIEKTVSRFCRTIYILCDTKIDLITADYKLKKSIKADDEIVKTDEEFLNMEVVDDMIWDFSGQTDACLDDFKSNIDTDKASIPYDPSSDPYNELIEKGFDNENRLINIHHLCTAAKYNVPIESRKFEQDIHKFYSNEIKEELEYTYDLAMSDKMKTAIHVYDILASAIDNMRIKKSIILLSTNSDSKMYKNNISESVNGFKYNMFEDLKNALEKLYNHMIETN